VPLKSEEYSTALIELVNAGYLFEYASKYCGENPTPASLKNFKLSEGEYKKFIDWLKSQQFSYSTQLEKKTNDLIASAKTEHYYDDLKTSLTELQNKISQYHLTDLVRLRPEISEILEEEIAFHYQLIAGQVEVSLSRDIEIQEAKKILADSNAYKKLLSPH
jgi:carboxyl-terminal processing protease